MAAQAVVQSPPCILGAPRPSVTTPGRRSLKSSSSSFLASPSSLSLLPAASASRFSMRLASKQQAYICRDCGYIYNERTPFDKKPDSYFCPVCGAPKRRFRAYQPAVSKDANNMDVRKARKAQLKRDNAIGNALPFAIVIGIAALAGLYLYLNNTY